MTMFSSEKMQWFAMRATYRRGMQIKALLDKEGINNFISSICGHQWIEEL